jgi:hypothetical protein
MRLSPLLAVLLMTGCSRCGSKPPPPVSALQRFVAGLAAEGPCARVIPSQWSPSWPVPVVENGQPAYRLFFFGRDGDQQKGFRFHQAEGDAEFTASGRVLSCSRRARAGAPLPETGSGTPETLGATLARERRLYSATEDVAALFAAGHPLTDAERKRVSDFSAAFAGLAEAGHAAAYREMNPAFWSWVEANGGKAPAS